MISTPPQEGFEDIQPQETPNSPESIYNHISAPNQTYVLNGRALAARTPEQQVEILLEAIIKLPEYLGTYYTARALDLADGGNRLGIILETLSQQGLTIPAFADTLTGGFFDTIMDQPHNPDTNAKEKLLLVHASDGCHMINYDPKKANPAARTRYLGHNPDPRLIAMLDMTDSSQMPSIARGVYEDRLKGSKINRILYYLNQEKDFACKSVINSTEVFGWAIDTRDVIHFFVEAEANGLINWEEVESIAELGTGTGGITGALAKLASRASLKDGKPRKLIGADINTHAKLHTEVVVNAEREVGTDLLETEIVLNGNVLADLISRGEKLDLLVSNPPYIPMPEEEFIEDYATRGERPIMAAIQDTELYKQMFTLGKEVLSEKGKVVFLASSLSVKEVLEMATTNGFEVRQVTEWRSVPLDLPEISNNPAWLDMILENEGVFIYDGVYPLGHKICIFVAGLPKQPEQVLEVEG